MLLLKRRSKFKATDIRLVRGILFLCSSLVAHFFHTQSFDTSGLHISEMGRIMWHTSVISFVFCVTGLVTQLYTNHTFGWHEATRFVFVKLLVPYGKFFYVY